MAQTPRGRSRTLAKSRPPTTAVKATGEEAISFSLNQEVQQFRTTAETVAIGDLEIRKNFANRVMILFGIANVGVLVGLSFIFWQDCIQLAAHLINPAERIIDGRVIMALLGATTVQLGTVIYTITRAIFPTTSAAVR